MSGGTQAIDRAAELLTRVVLADDAPTFAKLVDDTGLAKSTTSRLLQALERHRLVRRVDDGGYEAGPMFALYASRHAPDAEVVRLAHPTMEALSEATGETVNLAMVRGITVVQVAQIDSTFLLGTTNWVDVEVPAHSSALGKVFYAEGLITLPDSPMAALTPHTVTDPASFAQTLEAIRVAGFAEAFGELEEGLDAVAAPVRDHTGEVVAALGISGPSNRLEVQRDRIRTLITTHAATLSRTLGFPTRKDGAA